MQQADGAMRGIRKTYAELVAELVGKRREGRVLLVGIDGPGASGKSTLATGLAAASVLIDVVHMDDFHQPSSARYSGDLKLRPALSRCLACRSISSISHFVILTFDY